MIGFLKRGINLIKMEKTENYIACCGCYCKTRKAFTNNSCRGCIMGYATKERLGIGGRNV
jgi:hypothetical protein